MYLERFNMYIIMSKVRYANHLQHHQNIQSSKWLKDLQKDYYLMKKWKSLYQSESDILENEIIERQTISNS